MDTVRIYGTDREVNAVNAILKRAPLDADWYFQCSGKDIWYHVFPASDLINDVNLVAALSHLYPLMLYRFYDGDNLMQGRRAGINSDDYTNYNNSRNWNLHDILRRNYSLGYNLYPMDMRCNLTAAYHNLAATIYKAMANEALIVEEAIVRESSLAPSEEEYPIINARQWLAARRHDFIKAQNKTDDLRQRVTLISAVITMIDEHIKGNRA
jgi:hypothetical protein